MPDSLCRLSVKAGDGSAKGSVDLALPADVHVGLLMPSIVDIVIAETATQARRWRLSRIGGCPVDESMTLLENDVRDGDLLLLAVTDPPGPQWLADDPFQTAATFTDPAHEPPARSAAAACVYSAGCGAAALVGSQLADRHDHAVVAGAVAVSAMVAAVVMRRAQADAMACVALSVVAVVFSAATGFLAVPDGPLDGNVLLAAASVLAAAVLLLRLTGCGTVPLTAIATLAALLAAAAGGRIWMSTTAAGAAMSALSVAGLGISAKLSLSIAGLAPAMPRSDEASSAVDVSDAGTAFAHHCLTGIVIGLSCAAPLGTALVAWGGGVQDGRRWPVLAAFAAVVGLALLMRTATHVDRRRRIALGAGGMASMTVALAVLVTASPGHAVWAGVAATAAGVSALGRFFDVTISPVARRAAEIVEYAALAAVVPLACWAGDLYALVRGTSLI